MRVANVQSLIVKNLTQKGYQIDCQFVPMENDNGEFFIYKILSNSDKLIFSNNKELHGQNGVIIGLGLSSKNIKNVLQAILAQ